MKRLLYITLAMTVALLGTSSCDEEEAKPMVDLSGENVGGPLMSNAATGTVDISIDAASEVFEVFEWTAVDYGANVAVSYSLKMDISEDMSTAVNLVNTEELSASPTVKQINDGALGLGAAIGTETTLYFSLSSTINGVSESLLEGSAVSRMVTPYQVIIDYPMIYAPGAYQGWSPGDVNGRLFSYDFNSVYEGILRLKDGDNATVEFKLTPEPNWDNDWGGSLTAAGSGYTGTLEPKGSNFQVSAGTYYVTADVSNLTIELEKTEDWGIIGSGIAPFDWSVDVDMNYNGQIQAWELTTDLQVGEIKFRADDDWALNYGDTGADGSLEAGGDNIAITEAGNYTIQMDVENLTYTIIKNEE